MRKLILLCFVGIVFFALGLCPYFMPQVWSGPDASKFVDKELAKEAEKCPECAELALALDRAREEGRKYMDSFPESDPIEETLRISKEIKKETERVDREIERKIDEETRKEHDELATLDNLRGPDWKIKFNEEYRAKTIAEKIEFLKKGDKIGAGAAENRIEAADEALKKLRENYDEEKRKFEDSRKKAKALGENLNKRTAQLREKFTKELKAKPDKKIKMLTEKYNQIYDTIKQQLEKAAKAEMDLKACLEVCEEDLQDDIREKAKKSQGVTTPSGTSTTDDDLKGNSDGSPTLKTPKIKLLEESRGLREEIEKMIGEFKKSCDEKLLQQIQKMLSRLNSLQADLHSSINDVSFSEDQKEEIVNLFGISHSYENELYFAKRDCAKKALLGLQQGKNKNVAFQEKNWCRDKAAIPDDPYIRSKGTWNQAYDDQWAIKHIGFTTDKKSAWNVEDGSSTPVVVAVIDTGLDWNHKDINWENIWKNSGEKPDNGKDDDGNGYVDDVIGWNFIDDNNKPWDHDGHGTFVTGIIAAATDNKVGIAGINKGAKIMVLKGLNAFGHGRASSLAEAIFYAADNGARVINISAGGKHLTQTEQDAVNYAHKKGSVIIVAAGNEAMDTKDYSPSGLKNVIAVGATDRDDKRASFSNWGQTVDISAPGIDILSLRARRADFMLGIPDVDYKPQSAYVGKDKRYFRASGTSFAAPMVSGTASLILAKSPNLSNEQVERMLFNSTRDIEVPGWDQLTGYGLLDAGAALKADPNFYASAKIRKMVPARKDKKVIIQVIGTADSSDFKVAWAELGFGEKPEVWKRVGEKIKAVVKEDVLAEIPASEFNKKGKWSVKLVVETKKHGERFGLGSLDIQ